MLEKLMVEWLEIRQEKKRRMAELIKKAVDNRVHVDILVQSGEAFTSAYEYLCQLGLNKNEFVTIKPKFSVDGIDITHLSIPYEVDCL